MRKIIFVLLVFAGMTLNAQEFTANSRVGYLLNDYSKYGTVGWELHLGFFIDSNTVIATSFFNDNYERGKLYGVGIGVKEYITPKVCLKVDVGLLISKLDNTEFFVYDDGFGFYGNVSINYYLRFTDNIFWATQFGAQLERFSNYYVFYDETYIATGKPKKTYIDLYLTTGLQLRF